MAEQTWVVFDLGEVLSVSPPHLAELAAIAGEDAATFAAGYWGHREPYDAGQDATAYWTAVLGRDPGGELVARLTGVDVDAWIVLHPQSRALLDDLAAAGTPVGLLSNAPGPLARAVRAQDWAARLDVALFSADVGVTKPDCAIFAAAAQRYGVIGKQIVFFDDRAVNVEGAAAAGWVAHLWTGHAAARDVLLAAGLL